MTFANNLDSPMPKHYLAVNHNGSGKASGPMPMQGSPPVSEVSPTGAVAFWIGLIYTIANVAKPRQTGKGTGICLKIFLSASQVYLTG